MKIVIATPFYPPYPIEPGGAEHSLEQMCQIFAKEGLKLRVVTPCYEGNPGVERSGGIEIDRFASGITISSLVDGDFQKYFDSAAYINATSRAISQAVESHQRSIVIANNAQAIIPVVAASQKLGVRSLGIVRDAQLLCEMGSCIHSKKPSIALPCKGVFGAGKCKIKFCRERGPVNLRALPGIFLNGMHLGLRRERLRAAFLRTDTVITISEALKLMLSKLDGFAAKKIRVIQNFHTSVKDSSDEELQLFLERNKIDHRRFFLVVGKKSYGKGSDVAVNAARVLQHSFPDVIVVFAGRGERISSQEGVADVGQISQSLLMGLLRKSIGIIVPGRCQEGLHRTMIDSVWYGKPVICTEAGGVSEGVHHSANGYVVPCDDVHSLASAMTTVLSWREEEMDLCRITSKEIYEKLFSDVVLMKKWSEIFQL
jgi:glycosyltransferase involved in cell wall biosynthesis